MASKILYDTRTLEILKCQPKPFGLGLPSFEGLCRSARIPEDEIEFMGEITIKESYLTSDAKKFLKLVKVGDNVEVVRKTTEELNSLVELEFQKQQILKTKEQLKNDFIEALIEDDEEKMNTVKEKYKQLNISKIK